MIQRILKFLSVNSVFLVITTRTLGEEGVCVVDVLCAFICLRICLIFCSGDNMWFSFDLGPVHFLSFSTETDYPGAPHDVKKRRSSPTAQLDFIKADLASVNRSITPVVIVFAHRPIYVNSPGDVNLTNGEPTNQAKNIQDAFEEVEKKKKN